MAEKQWVNLPKDNAFTREAEAPLKRLGAVDVRFKLENGKPVAFRVSAKEVGGKPTAYSDREARFEAYQVVQNKSVVGTGSNAGTIEASARLPASGGTEWEIRGKRKGKTKEGPTRVVAWRRLYCQQISMDGTKPASLAPVKKLLEDAFIDLQLTAPATLAKTTIWKDVEYNVDDGDLSARQNIIVRAREVYALETKEPAAIAAVFVRTLAVKGEYKLVLGVSPTVTSKRKYYFFGDEYIDFTLPDGKLLWFGVDPNDDAQRDDHGIWMVRCAVFDGGMNRHVFSHEDVILDERKRVGRTSSGIRIRLTPEARQKLVGKSFSLSLQLITIDKFLGGYSERGVNIILVATEAFGRDVTPAEQQQTFNHELGHALGMVSEGFAGELDAPGTLYGGRGAKTFDGKDVDQKDHQGPHCSVGCSYDATRPLLRRWVGSPGCTMFGSTACRDDQGGLAVTPLDYCATCKELLRRTDLRGTSLRTLHNSLLTNLPL